MHSLSDAELAYKYEQKLKRIIKRSVEQKKNEKAIAGLFSLSSMLYLWNQKYKDNDIEQSIILLTEEFRKKVSLKKKIKDNSELCVMFYDSFGDDLRGLAAIYLKALAKLNCRLVYVTCRSAIGKQPIITGILNDAGASIEYIDTKSRYDKAIREIYDIYSEYQPDVAFEYITPWDIAGIIAFGMFENTCRFIINLTDHAFWSGLNSFDYCIEFRDYGANISEKYRAIPKDKIIKLPYYPYINDDVEFKGFPFDAAGKKVIFSGGSLYKTLGKNNLYYSMVADILDLNKDIVFLYAGAGDDTELKKLMRIYPDRVFHIGERNDLIRIMENSYLYLSTYPMTGGLMSQYAAVCGCFPVTLKHNDDANGILLNEDELGAFFDTKEELIAEVKSLIENPEYKRSKEILLQNSVISEDEFTDELKRIIIHKSSNYKIMNQELNLHDFQETYVQRFNKECIATSIASKRNLILLSEFPQIFFYQTIRMIITKIKQII